MATLEVLHQKYPQTMNVGYNDHALHGHSDWTFPNAKDSGLPPPSVAPLDFLPKVYSRKVEPAQAHPAGVDMHTYRESVPFDDNEAENADADAIDIDMYDIVEDPAQADVDMSDPDVASLIALFADWNPLNDSMEILTPDAKQQRANPRIINLTPPPISTTATSSTRSKDAPTSVCTTPTSDDLLLSPDLTLVELEIPPLSSKYASSIKDIAMDDASKDMEIDNAEYHDIAMGDASKLMDTQAPEDNDITMGDVSKDMDIDLHDEEDIIMHDILKDMDINPPEDLDITMHDAAYDMNIDIAEDTDIVLYDASDDMDID